MPTNPLMQLPKTKSEEEFESICTDILTDFYKKNFSRYGRSGQSQHGIDIYCDIDNEKRIVSQCKNYFSLKSTALTKQIENDIESATAEFDIDTFIVMTALDRDTKIQDFISNLKSNYSFSIELWFWEDIQEKILSNADLLHKYYPSLIRDSENARLEELYAIIKELQEQVFLGSKSKTVEENAVRIKIQERLNDSLRFLELSNESDVGVNNASRAIKRFLSIIDSIENEYINSLTDLVDKCFNYALNSEKKYNLDYVSHKHYSKLLSSQNRISEKVKVEESIVNKIALDTSPKSFEVAATYGKLASDFLHLSQFTDKVLLYIAHSLDCWIEQTETTLTVEQTLEISAFMDTIAQFFTYEADRYMIDYFEHEGYFFDYENLTSYEDIPPKILISIIISNVYRVVARLICSNSIKFDFKSIGFQCIEEIFNQSEPLHRQLEQISDMIKYNVDAPYRMELVILTDFAELCGMTSFSLIVEIVKKNTEIPLGYIINPSNTLALIVGEQKRTELQKELFIEAIEYIEKQKDGLEKSRRLSIAYHNYGGFLQDCGDIASAEIYYLYSIDEEKRIASEYSEKSKFTLAMAHIALANLFEIDNKNKLAISQYEQAVKVFEDIEKTKSDIVTYHKEYIKCLTTLAQQYRISWLKSVEEIGYFTLDYANDCMEVLSKARLLCIENYDSAIDEYGSALVKVSVEIAQVLSWLEPHLKSAAKNEDLIKEAIRVCEDMIINKSEANNKSFMFVINYQKECYIRAANSPNISQDTFERILTNVRNCFEEIILFLSENVKDGEVDPKYLFHPALRKIPTDFMIATNNPPWFFELAHSFQTIYYICFSTLCEIARNAEDTEKIKELCEQANGFIEIIKDEIGFFMYNTELKKIENNIYV
jgi:hypothetical protein